jgi:hypothetical protein
MHTDHHHEEDHGASFTVGIIFIAVLMIIALIGLLN